MKTKPNIPGYEIEGPLGEGGMGAVYRARRSSDGLIVALKLAQAGEGQLRHRLRRELAISKTFAHPYLVKILDGDLLPQSKDCYVVMELLDGQDLSERCLTSALAIDEAVHILRMMAEALSYLHVRRLIHRDIKPSNIFLAADGRAVLLDFGLALALDMTRLTETGSFVGTMNYMAPEQLLGKTVTPASDIYSLGVTLYRSLTSTLPFESESLLRLTAGFEVSPPEDPRSLRPDVPRWLARLLMQSLSFDPKKRFPSGEALLSAIAQKAAATTDEQPQGTMTTTAVLTPASELTAPKDAGQHAGTASPQAGLAPSPATATVSLRRLLQVIAFVALFAVVGTHLLTPPRQSEVTNHQELFSDKRDLRILTHELLSTPGIPDDESCATVAALLRRTMTATDTLTPTARETFVIVPTQAPIPPTAEGPADMPAAALADIPPVPFGLFHLAATAFRNEKFARAADLYLELIRRFGFFTIELEPSLAYRFASTYIRLGDRRRLREVADELVPPSMTSKPELAYARALFLTEVSFDTVRPELLAEAYRLTTGLLENKPSVVSWDELLRLRANILDLQDTNEARDELRELMERHILGRPEIRRAADIYHHYRRIASILSGHHRDLSRPVQPKHQEIAFKYMEKALAIARATKDERREFGILLLLAQEHIRHGDKTYGFELAQSIAKMTLSQQQRYDYHVSLARAFRDNYKYDQALEQVKLAKRHDPNPKDSSNFEELIESIKAMRAFAGPAQK